MIKLILVNRKFQLAFTLFFIALISLILFAPPQVGIANSGDFGRIMDIFDLYYTSNYSNFTHFFDVFTFGRPIDGPHYNGYIATSSLFILIALFINKIFNLFTSDDFFYIYSLSVVYTFFYAIGFYIFIDYFYKNLKSKYLVIALSGLSLIILSDSLFVEYFNSFFQEPGYIVCLLLFIACFLQLRLFWLDLLLITLIIFSKSQYLLYLLLLIPLYIKYKISFNPTKIILVIIAISMPIYVFTQINIYSKGMNQFASIFSGLLHNDSKEQGAKVLSSINMDPNYAVFTDMGYWTVAGQLNSSHDPNTYNLWQQAIADSNQLKTLHGYLLQPTKIFTNSYDYLNIVEKEGPFAPNLGNYKVDQGERFRVTTFTLFSNCAKHLRFLFIFNILMTIVLLAKKRVISNNQNRYSLLIILNIIVILAIPSYIIATGYEETVKHILDVYFDEGIIFILIMFEFSLKLQQYLQSRK
jgi:hypothetical protein